MTLGELSDEALHSRVQQLLAEYVEFIDDDRLEQWADLFVERAVYRVVPRENADRGLPAAAIDCDSRGMLVDRVVSLRQANIYGVHYHRLLLSNLRITARNETEARAQCNYAVLQTRSTGETSIYNAGKYLDRIVAERQYVHGNWKLYAENTRDPYHASLLHLFHTTFGTYRSSQKGGVTLDAEHRHSLLQVSSDSNDAQKDHEIYKDMRIFDAQFRLQNPTLLAARREFDDGVTLVILSVFPNLIVQQIANTLAVRQIVPSGPDAFELVWTSFGYADDDADMQRIRLKHGNLIGPTGLTSMEDGEAVEIVQRAVASDDGQPSFIAMGGGRGGDAEHLVTESSIIGFWEYYRTVVDFEPARPR